MDGQKQNRSEIDPLTGAIFQTIANAEKFGWEFDTYVTRRVVGKVAVGAFVRNGNLKEVTVEIVENQ